MRKETKKSTVVLKAGVVIRHRGRILLIRERNNRTLKYKWNIIKGTFDPKKDTSIISTAIREACEEAGAKISLKYFLGIYYLKDDRSALTMFTFVADLLNPQVKAPSPQTQAKYGSDRVIGVKFFTKQELSKLKPADFIGERGYLSVQDYLKGIRFPLDILKVLPPQ